MKPENTVFLAGKKAFDTIREGGLKPESVKAIYGAAGGPKWLTLNRFDRMLFTQWLKSRKSELFLLGSSIGAWRFSTMCQEDPLDAQSRFEVAYIYQTYSRKPSTAEITAESRRIMDSFLDEKAVGQILQHPLYRINFLSVRSKWPVNGESKARLGFGLLGSVLLNLVNRKALRFQFERTLFHYPGTDPPFLLDREFPVTRVELNRKNYKEALLASGSIPLVMEGVRNIPDAPEGIYRDGGLIDYHLDIPSQLSDHEILLYPHFSQRIVPGWLDKQLKWRKPKTETIENMLLVAPSQSYLDSLPNGKIPDRNDFYLYQGRDKERFRDWNLVVEEGQKLADEFHEAVESGNIRNYVQLINV